LNPTGRNCGFSQGIAAEGRNLKRETRVARCIAVNDTLHFLITVRHLMNLNPTTHSAGVLGATHMPTFASQNAVFTSTTQVAKTKV
jgi:hypothetical protein